MTTDRDAARNSDGPPAAESAPGGPGALNPAALTAEQLAKMLALPVAKIREHLEAGAPANRDGTVNLVNYTAWLNRRLAELARNDGD